jgi:uncharacterized protein (UPF0261 family)
VYDHNPEYALVRTSHDEMIQLGHVFAERLGLARGPVVIAVPTRGLSIPNVPDGVFWNPEADAAFLDSLRGALKSRGVEIPITTYEYHINDSAFGELVADLFVQVISNEVV